MDRPSLTRHLLETLPNKPPPLKSTVNKCVPGNVLGEEHQEEEEEESLNSEACWWFCWRKVQSVLGNSDLRGSSTFNLHPSCLPPPMRRSSPRWRPAPQPAQDTPTASRRTDVEDAHSSVRYRVLYRGPRQASKCCPMLASSLDNQKAESTVGYATPTRVPSMPG